MSHSRSSYLEINGKLMVGFRVVDNINALGIIESIGNGLRATIINDEVGLVLIHTVGRVILKRFYEARLSRLIRSFSKYLEPLPSDVTRQVVENSVRMYTRVSINTLGINTRGKPINAVTLCRRGNEIKYTMYTRGSGLNIDEFLNCEDELNDAGLVGVLGSELPRAPAPGGMVSTLFYPIDIDLNTHLIILGSTGSGKSTLAKILINHALNRGLFNRVLVFDMTGEYSVMAIGKGYVAIPGIDISVNPLILPSHRASEVIASAVQAVAYMYGEETGNLTFIQLEVLEKALEGLNNEATLLDLLRNLDLMSELYKRIDYLNAIMAVKRRIRKLLFSALMGSRLSGQALRSRFLVINMSPLFEISQTASILFIQSFLEIHRELLNNALIVIDEAHRIVNRGVVGETIVEQILREGRHSGTVLILITQNPLDIKRNVLDVAPQYAVFRLSGSSAIEASRLVNKEPENLLNLDVLEFYYHNRSFTVRAYIDMSMTTPLPPTVHEFTRKLIRKMLEVGDEDKIRELARYYGRAANPIIIPHVIDEGLREGYTPRELIEMAAVRDVNYMKILSRVMMSEH
ncbi:ATP-binding protein [Vulcanisaeta thermophila]|uniref:ATP-binding protein n=1 Tax=Vulcanisaeta thermophila TaxID=867917 RepID=UPI0008538B57|nr:ATP-binding protein [Vulcanisaeta thermophila]